jgi:hypothetical protein
VPKEAIKGAFEEYKIEVGDMAENYFENHVRPFCVKRGWFFAGNGEKGWEMGPPKHGFTNFVKCEATCDRVQIIEDQGDECRAIIEAIRTKIPGMAGREFGSLMPSYCPEAEERKES